MLSAFLVLIKSVLPAWPEWALDLLIIMTALLIVTGSLTTLYEPDDEKKDKEFQEHAVVNGSNGASNGTTEKTAQQQHDLLQQYHAFRWKYVSVYAIIMLADWMQGTHMYTLYMSYGVNVSALFLTGFLSGGLFAPFLGSFVDKLGRQKSCIFYCALEIAINILEGFDNFAILLAGRVLGGISTNLLFSAFESWMTTEHRRLGFDEAWLSRTYSQCSIVNGATAIGAGVVAQLLEDALGHIGPFHGAVALTAVALMMILGWRENYGETNSDEKAESESKTSVVQQFWDGWTTVMQDSRVWRIGLIQALSEGAMYTFVFLWVPTLLSLEYPGGVPTGCVFSSLMMAITMGGLIFPPLQALMARLLQSEGGASELCASVIYLTAAAAMAVPVVLLAEGEQVAAESRQFWMLVAFMVMELCVGLFMPVAGTLRSKYVPDALQGAILNIFRLPLNAIVVSGTYATNVLDSALVFRWVCGCFVAAAVLQVTMIESAMKTTTTTSTPAAKPAATTTTTTGKKTKAE